MNMWRNILYRGSLILALAVVCSRSAFAQVSYSPQHAEWEVSGFVGGSFGDKFEFPTPVYGNDQRASRTVGMEYDSGYAVGLRVNENLGDYWGAELEYSFANQHLRFTNLSPSIQNLSLNHYLHNITYSVSFLPLPRTKRFRPYGAVGAGAALFYLPGRVKKDTLELGLSLRDSWELAFNGGGGFRYLVRDGFALAFDMKTRFSRVPSYGLPGSARVLDGRYQPGIAVHGTLHNTQLNFGFTYQWDEF
jgi:opacity protein-like surface antigen